MIRVGSNCDKISINRTIYTRNNALFTAVPPNINFTWSSMDESMTYAVVNGSIWKWNTT